MSPDIEHSDVATYCCYAPNGKSFASCSRNKFIIFIYSIFSYKNL